MSRETTSAPHGAPTTRPGSGSVAMAAAAVGVLALVVVTALAVAMLRMKSLVIGPSTLSAAQADRLKADIQTLTVAFEAYRLGAGRYPTTTQGIESLVDKPTIEPMPSRWHRLLNTVPTDAWKRPYRYRYPSTHAGQSFDVWSAGSDGADGTGDDFGNWMMSTPTPP